MSNLSLSDLTAALDKITALPREEQERVGKQAASLIRLLDRRVTDLWATFLPQPTERDHGSHIPPF